MKVERFLSEDARGVRCVRAEDFDRVEAERDALQALLNERDAQVDRLTALSVSHIMLRVEPGPDGMGVEVYADSVAQVIEALDSACNWVEVLQDQLHDAQAEILDLQARSCE